MLSGLMQNESWVPHISLVFGGKVGLPQHFTGSFAVDPHLAKNERDMGHPSFVEDQAGAE
jgi:hypothetical protein